MKAKKFTIELAVLLLLIVIIGSNQLGSTWRMMIVDGRTQEIDSLPTRTPTSDTTGKKLTSLRPKISARRTTCSTNQPIEPLQQTPVISTSETVDQIVINGLSSPFHFIHSQKIVGSKTKPTTAQKDRLKEAARAILVSLEPGTILFDADTESSERGYGVLLYARSELDLTDSVKQVYDRLSQGEVEFAGK